MRFLSIVSIAALTLAACDPGESALSAPEYDAAVAALAAPIELGLDIERAADPRALTITVTGLNPGEDATLFRGIDSIGDGACLNSLAGACLDLGHNPRDLGTATANASGEAVFLTRIAASAPTGVERLFQAVAVRAGTDAVASNPVRVRATDDLARLRAVHASPDAPPVDIYANGALLLADVPFSAASGFLEVPAGDYTVDIRAAGAPSASAPVFSVDLSLMPNQQYTAIASGFLTSTDTADAFRIIPLVEDWGIIDPTAVRVRILHGSPDAPTVAIDVGNDGTLDIPALDRFAETGATGVALPADTPLAVGIATTAGDKVTAFSVPPLPAGGEVTVIAIGELGAHPSFDNGFSALALFRDGTSARILQDPVVYALHASPGAPEVDILAGGAVLTDNLAFRDLSGAIQVPPGAYDLDIEVSANGALVGSFTTPDLEAGQRYLATATGFAGGAGEPFQLVYTVDGFKDDDAARGIIVHASPDAPPVDIGGIDGGVFSPVLTGVPFGAQTPARGIRIAPMMYDLGFAVAGDPNPLFTFNGVGVNAGSRVIYLATGSVAAGDFGVTVVDTTASPWATATVFPN